MRVRFKECVAGNAFAFRRNQEIDLPDHFAASFIRAGQAVEIAAAAPTTEPAHSSGGESMAIAPPENASLPRPLRRRGK